MGEKLWQGRFEQPMNKQVEEFTASIHFDKRLYRYDIEGSIAHSRMLAACKIISDDEASRIVAGLGEIQREIERALPELPAHLGGVYEPHLVTVQRRKLLVVLRVDLIDRGPAGLRCQAVKLRSLVF